jgi:hypothetical protein
LSAHRKLLASAPAIAAALLSLLVYAVSLGGTYIYDDRAIVQEDARLRSPGHWGQLWTTDYFNGGSDNLYRPLVSTSYALEWWLHGDRPWAFHLVNWLLQAAVAAMVAELARRGAGQAPAYLAGLLFAVHPVHVEAVVNIVGRAELMCALGVLGALIVFARRPLTPRRVAAIFACTILAVLSKEQGVLLPALLLFYGWFVWRYQQTSSAPARQLRSSLTTPTPGSEACPERSRRVLRRPGFFWSDEQSPGPRKAAALKGLVILLTWCMAGYLFAREHFLKIDWDRSFLDWSMQPMIQSLGLDRALMPLVLLGHYTQLLFFPIKLSPDYGGGVIGSIVHPNDPYLWLGVAAILAWLIVTAIALKRRAGFVVFCLLSLAITYGLIGNIFMLIGTNMAERLMYLPSAFFLMAVALPLAKLPRRPRIAVMAILLVLGSWRSFTYARRWNHRLDFYRQSLAEQPKSVQLYLLTGDEYRQLGQLQTANEVLLRAAIQFPKSWKVWVRLAEVATDAGRLDDARRYLQKAIDLKVDASELDLRERLDKLQATTRPASGKTPGPPGRR